MIVSFADDDTRALASGQRVIRFMEIERVAVRKLRQLEVAGSVNDLRVPPGNHLEKLQGDWSGFYSIRINARWRLCFIGLNLAQKMYKSLTITRGENK